MGYYDSVKDSVRDSGDDKESDSSSGSEAGEGNFDTLVEAAQKTSNEDDEEKGDDTPIEVLEEDGLRKRRSRDEKQNQEQRKERKSRKRKDQKQQKREPDKRESKARENGKDFSGIEEKLEKIIEQNSRMIEILEGFGS